MKKKLPAYGKALLAQRRGGNHPLTVTLVYGDDWSAGREPRVCLKPEDYAPGRFDFGVLAGTKVVVLDQGIAAAGPPEVEHFHALLGELADADAVVFVEWPESSGCAPMTADVIARCERSGPAWPSWWSDELEARHTANWIAWLEDVSRVVKNRCFDSGRERAAA